MKRDVSSFFCNSMNKYFVLLTFDIILSNLCLMMNIRVTESVSQNYCPSLYNYNHFNSKILLWFFPESFNKCWQNIQKTDSRFLQASYSNNYWSTTLLEHYQGVIMTMWHETRHQLRDMSQMGTIRCL